MTAAGELRSYFDQLWGDTEGFVYLPVKGVDGFRKFMIPWPAKADAVVSHVLKYAADPAVEVFYSPAIFKEKKPAQASVLGSWYAWVDFDGNFPETWPKDIAPLPTIEIQSSVANKRHAYWALKEFTGPKKLEEINRSLAYALGADLSGWDANQFLRPPFSTHRKGKPTPVKLLHNRLDRVYDYEAFAHIPTPKEAIKAQVEIDELPAVEEVLAEAKWDDELYELFSTSGDEMKQAHRDRSGALQRLAYEGAEHSWTDEQIMVVLLDADARWGKYTNRSKETREKILVDLINRARGKIGYNPEGELEALKKALDLSVKVEDEDDDRLFYSVQELAHMKGIDDWIVDGMLTPRGLGLFTGRPGVGKTQLAFQLSADLASGREEFMGHKLSGKPAKVLFLSLEMNKYQLPHIARPLFGRYPEMDQRNLAIYAKGEMLPLDQPSGQNFLEALLTKMKPDVVVIDSLSHMASADLTSDKEMKDAFEFLQKARNQYNFGLVIIHHHRKKANDAQSRKQPNTQSDVYGSFYITAAVDFILDLETLPDDLDEGTITMSMLKNRYAQIEQPVKVIRNNKLHFDIAEDLVKAFIVPGGDHAGPSLGI